MRVAEVEVKVEAEEEEEISGCVRVWRQQLAAARCAFSRRPQSARLAHWTRAGRNGEQYAACVRMSDAGKRPAAR